jgi:hypothetical protein
MANLLILLAILAAGPREPGEQLIFALAKMTPSVEYVTDGAADVSVMSIGQTAEGVVEHPPGELARIVSLRLRAVPLLIAHLDDKSPTNHRFAEVPDLRVPLGFVCLDILSMITEGPMVVSDCTDDGFGACVAEGYFFRPDSPRKDVLAVKRAWEKAYREGKVRFVAPSWWAGG